MTIASLTSEVSSLTLLLRVIGLTLFYAAICWLPLRDTGANRGRWPLKLNEYMAAGRPVVATAVGDVAILVRKHEIGLLALDRPEDLAEATTQLLGDPARRDCLGRNARQVAEEVLDWALLAERLESFYHDVLSKRQT